VSVSTAGIDEDGLWTETDQVNGRIVRGGEFGAANLSEIGKDA